MVTVPSVKRCIFREGVQIKDSLDEGAWLALHSALLTLRVHTLQWMSALAAEPDSNGARQG
jgi:hypothetical protein